MKMRKMAKDKGRCSRGNGSEVEKVEEVEEVEVEEVLARVSPRTMGSVVMVWSGVSPCVSPLPHSTTQPRLGLPA